MTRALSFQSTTKRARSAPIQSRETRRTLVRVPELNWPSNLFDDNVADFNAEEFGLQWGLVAMTWDRQDPEMYILAAA